MLTIADALEIRQDRSSQAITKTFTSVTFQFMGAMLGETPGSIDPVNPQTDVKYGCSNFQLSLR